MSVVVGTNDLTKIYDAYEVDYIKIHPENFEARKQGRYSHDIALVHLSEPLEFNKSVREIPLQTDSLKNKKIKAVLTGWGKNEV